MLAFLIVAALVVSTVLNTTIKGWVYANIIEPELDEMQEDEESRYLFFTALGLVLINNLIPFTLGAAIGLYAIL